MGIHRNSNSQNGSSLRSVEVHSCTFSHIHMNMKCDSRASLLATHGSMKCDSRVSFLATHGSMKCDSRASFLATHGSMKCDSRASLLATHGSMKCDSRASFLATHGSMKCDPHTSFLARAFASLCFGREPKVRVVTIYNINLCSITLRSNGYFHATIIWWQLPFCNNLTFIFIANIKNNSIAKKKNNKI